MRTWHARILPHSRSAKTKGIITGRGLTNSSDTYTVHARDKEEAFAKLEQEFLSNDKRPLSGKSYLRADPVNMKVGQRVRLLYPYLVGHDEHGNQVRANKATITEVVSENYYSVHPDGYHNQYVDFVASELEKL